METEETWKGKEEGGSGEEEVCIGFEERTYGVGFAERRDGVVGSEMGVERILYLESFIVCNFLLYLEYVCST